MELRQSQEQCLQSVVCCQCGCHRQAFAYNSILVSRSSVLALSCFREPVYWQSFQCHSHSIVVALFVIRTNSARPIAMFHSGKSLYGSCSNVGMPIRSSKLTMMDKLSFRGFGQRAVIDTRRHITTAPSQSLPGASLVVPRSCEDATDATASV